MHARLATAFPQGGSLEPQAPLVLRAGRVALLVLPLGLLLAVSVRLTGSAALLLWLGTLFQGLAFLLALLSRRAGQEPVGPVVIMLDVIALSWLLLGGVGLDDWFLHLAQAALLVVPLGLFAVQCLNDSGATSLRRARQLASRLANRLDWPAELQACRLLPEVKALREALHVDASPALALLRSPRPQVRVAALAALEFRPNWQPGQPEVVLGLAQHSNDPEVRAAAVMALANVDDRPLIEALADFLCDPSPLVRQTAAEALLWDTEHHWPWIRQAVRRALASPVCQDDGPLRHEGNLLTAEAVADLTAWASEKGHLAVRAALTLARHYQQVLSLDPAQDLVDRLRRQLVDPHAPSLLRLELAHLLHQQRELDTACLRALLEPSNPAPLRVIAVEALLSGVSSSEDDNAGRAAAGIPVERGAPAPTRVVRAHDESRYPPEAIAALRDLARLPNREIALNIAEVLQRHLGIPLGLLPDEPLPPIHSRQAAEVARRVLLWATQQDLPDPEPAAASEG